jgi:HK97 family phage major capsid protein
MGGVAAFGKAGAKFLTSEAGKSDDLRPSEGDGGRQRPVDDPRPGRADSYLGYPIELGGDANAVTDTDVNKVMFLFGRYDLAASMGNRRGIEVQVLRERYAELGQVGIKATERFDMVVHDVGSTTAKGPVAAGYGA